MTASTTEPDESRRNLYELTDAQRVAIDALVSGCPVTDAASAAGVARQTVSLWRNHHFGFIAELNNRRAELEAERLDAMLNLDRAALSVLANAVQDGDTGSAVAWLKMRQVGALTTEFTRALSPQDVHDERMIEVLARPESQKTALDRMLEDSDGKMTCAEARSVAAAESRRALLAEGLVEQ